MRPFQFTGWAGRRVGSNILELDVHVAPSLLGTLFGIKPGVVTFRNGGAGWYPLNSGVRVDPSTQTELDQAWKSFEEWERRLAVSDGW